MSKHISQLPSWLAMIGMVIVFAFQVHLSLREQAPGIEISLRPGTIAFGYASSTPSIASSTASSTASSMISMASSTSSTVSSAASSTAVVCGDGRRVSSENCDDGNTTAGDGCSASCTVETGFTCTGAINEQSTCTAVCGDAMRYGGEGCDDGNTTAGDGCSNACTVETGYACSGSIAAISVCTTTCGDGIVGGSEQCDDGNNSNADACLTNCHTASCGDGHVRSGVEQCDPPGSEIAGQGSCNAACGLVSGGGGGGSGPAPAEETAPAKKFGTPRPSCGNGIVDVDKGEECDEGHKNGFSPTCTQSCLKAECGDGLVNPEEEECEPLRKNDGTFVFRKCGQACTLPLCTISKTQGAEQSCSGGCHVVVFQEECPAEAGTSAPLMSKLPKSSSLVSPQSEQSPAEKGIRSIIQSLFQPILHPILSSPYRSTCGDTKLERGEQCDDGNVFDGDGCSATCGLEPAALDRCGNGILEAPEQCDDGKDNSDVTADSCRKLCQMPHCGDGVQDTGEQCDDGNDIAGDGCAPTCEPSICGNGTLEPGEECDDGLRNAASRSDACRPTCLMPRCGDGILDRAFAEQCDAGSLNADEPDACRLDCAKPRCGDGITDHGEQCDDANTIDNDGCTNACIKTLCGDDVIQTKEQCDDGNNSDGDGCSPTCVIEAPLPFLERLIRAAIQGMEQVAEWMGVFD